MTEFLGLDFYTTKDTFIPRPETELLVKACVAIIEEKGSAAVLDIGTGCGNIAVSLALSKVEGLTNICKNCTIVALDSSAEALKTARCNAERYGVCGRVSFIKSDLYAGLPAHFYNYFDIIVSNPPYVPSWEILTLAEHVRSEPDLALDGGADGLEVVNKIIEGAPRFLRRGGSLIMEIGYGQSYRVKKGLERYGGYKDIRIIRDFSNIERIVIATWTD